MNTWSMKAESIYSDSMPSSERNSTAWFLLCEHQFQLTENLLISLLIKKTNVFVDLIYLLTPKFKSCITVNFSLPEILRTALMSDTKSFGQIKLIGILITCLTGVRREDCILTFKRCIFEVLMELGNAPSVTFYTPQTMHFVCRYNGWYCRTRIRTTEPFIRIK